MIFAVQTIVLRIPDVSSLMTPWVLVPAYLVLSYVGFAILLRFWKWMFPSMDLDLMFVVYFYSPVTLPFLLLATLFIPVFFFVKGTFNLLLGDLQ